MTVYPSITTTKGDWRARIEEAQDLGLREICFFPTKLSAPERWEAYEYLKKAGIEGIPFVHLRSDMTREEINFFQRVFKTKRFNVHAAGAFVAPKSFDEYRDCIYAENSTWRNVLLANHPEEEKQIQRFAGICLDTAHLEDDRREQKPHYDHFGSLLEQYPCGVWHVSACKHEKIWDPKHKVGVYDWHSFEDLSEFDYLEHYQKFLPSIVALELENTLVEQLEAKAYIESMFRGL